MTLRQTLSLTWHWNKKHLIFSGTGHLIWLVWWLHVINRKEQMEKEFAKPVISESERWFKNAMLVIHPIEKVSSNKKVSSNRKRFIQKKTYLPIKRFPQNRLVSLRGCSKVQCCSKGTGMLSQWTKEQKITSKSYIHRWTKPSNIAKHEGGLGTSSWYLNEIPIIAKGFVKTREVQWHFLWR